MSKKADLYEVLGVSKTATPEEIAKAFKRIVFATHSDKLKNMSDAEKKQASEKLQLATEANDVLSNPDKRNMYDQYGHEGLDNMRNAGKTGNSGPSQPAPRRPFSFEEAARSFGVDLNSQDGADDGAPVAPATPIDTSEAARIRAEARAARRSGAVPVAPKPYTPPPAPEKAAAPAPRAATPQAPKPSTSFGSVSEDMRRVGERLNTAEVPLEALEQFRDNVRDFLAVLDQAVAKAKPSGFDR